jgi:protein-tyrosine-phosphatase
MAEAMARDIYGIEHASSRGVAAVDGGQASPRAIEVMSRIYGIDITGHISRGITEADADAAEIILTMTESHREHVSQLFPFVTGKLFTISSRDISDPFMQGFDAYASCAEEINQCLGRLYGPEG